MVRLSLSRAWDETKAVLARDGRLFLWVALALFVLPGVVLNVSVPEARAGELPSPGIWLAIGLIAIIVSLIGQLSVIRLGMGPHVSVGEAIAHGARRLLPYIAAVLMWIIPFMIVGLFLFELMGQKSAHPRPGAAFGLLLLTALGFYIAVRLLLASGVASAEARGPVAILQRSWALSKGNWWRLFAFLLLFGIGAFVLLIAVQSVMTLIAQMMLGGIGPLSLGGLVVAIVSQLVSASISVVFFVMIARIYVQLAGAGEVQPSVPSSGT